MKIRCQLLMFILSCILLFGSTRAWLPPSRSSRLVPGITRTTAKGVIAVPWPETGQLDVPMTGLAEQDQWIAKLDYEGFGREVAELGKQLQREAGSADVEHLQKILGWRDAAALIGIATLWMAPNPLTVVALSTWSYASWTMVAHHTCHGGYNRVDAGKYNSRGFALGKVSRRVSDWLDWMMPEAWNVEHNRLHHYRLNESSDPDLVQRNLEFLRQSKLPNVLKYTAIGLLMCVWKFFYYAPNTYKELQIARWEQQGKEFPTNYEPNEPATMFGLFLGQDRQAKALRQVISPQEFILNVIGPMILFRYFVLSVPLLAIPSVGPALFGHAIVNLILAEMLTNIHGFITIVTNHAGKDLYTFDDAVKPRSSAFYVRQIVGSANYALGSDMVDFAHGWLNYQIEHHVWPDLSMRQYQEAAPKLEAICTKYGVPYIKESVFARLRKTVDVMIGKEAMRTFPTEYEPARDKASATGVTSKLTRGTINDED